MQRPRFIQAAALTLLTSCTQASQPTDARDDQIRALTQQVAALSAQVKTLSEDLKSLRAEFQQFETNQTARVGAPSEFRELMRMARHLVAAIGAGINYQDFNQEFVNLAAAATEAVPKVKEAQRPDIACFVLAMADAQSLWKYKIVSGADRMRIRKIDGYYAPLDYPQALDNRWKSSDFLDMVERYSLHDTNGFTGPIIDQTDGPKLLFDRAIERIFGYAVKKFHDIEKSE